MYYSCLLSCVNFLNTKKLVTLQEQDRQVDATPKPKKNFIVKYTLQVFVALITKSRLQGVESDFLLVDLVYVDIGV